MSTLHITNGDATVDLLNAAEFSGTFLPWRDILHMGPVHTHLPLNELSLERADYISGQGWGERQSVVEDFRQRDEALAQCDNFESITLWFEHDLYDQLQLLQLLSWFDDHEGLLAKVTLINPDKHLGYHTPDEAKLLPDIGVPVTKQMTELAKRCWYLFGCENLSEWVALVDEDTSALPHLRNAIAQSIDELPELKTGLNGTERAILTLIDEGHDQPGKLFRAYCQSQPAQFHGDMSFFWFLKQLIDDSPALIEQSEERFHLTDIGKKILANNSRWQRHYSQQHWLGGFEISGDARTFWDSEASQLKTENT